MLHWQIKEKVEQVEVAPEKKRVLAQFKSELGETVGAPFDLPLDITALQLQLICDAILNKDEPGVYSFYVNDLEITGSLEETLQGQDFSSENVLDIIYQPQAVFQVEAVTRCTSALPGHAEAVIAVAFSPDGRYLASGSGDTTVRFWDINTQTPHLKCEGHRHWVLCIAWSPDGRKLASADKNGQIMVWNPETGKQMGKSMVGHKKWVTSLCWEPLHRNAYCRRLASASKDCTIRVWDTFLGSMLVCLSSHVQSVTCLRWSGTGQIYSGSQDRTIRSWNPDTGALNKVLKGHAHWVNSLTLSTDYVMRTGAYDPKDASDVFGEMLDNDEQLLTLALERYRATICSEPERMVSGSDDFTLYLWQPDVSDKPITRMPGHQQLVNDVRFSPDVRMIASASFDKSIKLWDGRTGKFLASLRGHVQAVYQICWSADSRLLVSGSADSTLKVWNLKRRKLEQDLPGHADAVYAVDWSPDGQRVCSGGKDKVLKLWQK